VVTIIGILSMLLPPFGVLLCKWMALEAASDHLFVIVMMALGSALTFVYWARWAGLLMGGHKISATPEKQPLFTRGPLVSLCIAALLFAFATPYLYTKTFVPMFVSQNAADFTGILKGATGGFAIYPFIVLIGLATIFAIYRALRVDVKQAHPYLGGAHTGDIEDGAFLGPVETVVPYKVSNFYLADFFGEHKLTFWVNLIAGGLILLMIGGVL
jgi:ech hydrogenase subunit A